MNKDKIILDLCGGTGAWSKPYKDNGYTVYNITLPEYDVTKCCFTDGCIGFEHQSYVGKIPGSPIIIPTNKIYGILAAPPCTQFSFARARNTNLKTPRDLKKGIDLVYACLKIIWECQYEIKMQADKKTTLKFWALENPNGFLKHFLGKSAFVFDPWEFGNMYKKRTHLWGWFNEPKKTWFIKPNTPKFGYDKNIKSNPRDRAITPPGFSKAFYESNK